MMMMMRMHKYNFRITRVRVIYVVRVYFIRERESILVNIILDKKLLFSSLIRGRRKKKTLVGY